MKNKAQLVGKNDKSLKTKCCPVDVGENLSELVADMFAVMRSKGGVGLAAPQIGITRRVIVVEYGAICSAIINPVITKVKGKVVKSIGEGCLSFPGKRVTVKRSKRVVIEGFDENWKPVCIDARNLLAFIIQHEIDHLNGITIV